MCLGGHLAFRCAFDERVSAAVCYFATDIHGGTLGKGGDDSLDRVRKGSVKGELIMVSIVPKKRPIRIENMLMNILDLWQE